MKAYAVIDSQNLNLGVQSLGWKLDFAKFRKYLADKYKVEKAFYLEDLGVILSMWQVLRLKLKG